MKRNEPPVTRGILVATGRIGDAPLDQLLHGGLPPLVDRPIALRAAEMLVALGCRQLEVVLGEKPGPVRELLGDGSRFGCTIRYHYARDDQVPLDASWILPGAPDEILWFGCDRSLPAQGVLESIEVSRGRDADGIALYTDRAGSRSAWCGWGCFSVRFLRVAAARRATWAELDAQMPRLRRMRRRHAAQVLEFGNAAALIEAQKRFLLEPDAPIAIAATRQAPGLWISPLAKVHPGARIVAPAYVGAHSVVEAGATVGPGAVILEQCAVGAGTSVQDALVLRGTLIGPELNVHGAVLNGDLYLHAALETTISVTDRGLLAAAAQAPRRQAKVPVWQRVLAAALWPLTAPWLLYRLARGQWPESVTQAKDGLFKNQPRAWREHLINVALPRLGLVVAGHAGLTGLELRSEAEIRRLDPEWRDLYAQRRMGLVSESLLLEEDGQDLACRRMADLYASAHGGALNDLRLLAHYARRLLQEARDAARGAGRAALDYPHA